MYITGPPLNYTHEGLCLKQPTEVALFILVKYSVALSGVVRMVAFQTFFRRGYFSVPDSGFSICSVCSEHLFQQAILNCEKQDLTKREKQDVAFRKVVTIFELIDKAVRF